MIVSINIPFIVFSCIDFNGGKVNCDNLLPIIIIFVFFYGIAFKFIFRTITVYDDFYIYRGLFLRAKVRYKDIKKVMLCKYEEDNGEIFFEVQTDKVMWKISNINSYSKNDIAILLNSFYRNPHIIIDKDLIEKTIKDAKWIENISEINIKKSRKNRKSLDDIIKEYNEDYR